MRRLKVTNKDGSTSTLKLPKTGTGKGTPAWYRREAPSAADIKAAILKRGGTFRGTRQR
jgi:hypothetical protein